MARLNRKDTNKVRQVVRTNGAELSKVMKKNADFEGHFEGDWFVYPTGTTKRSIRLSVKDAGLRAEVAPKTYYSPYLEHGTRFMNAQPFVKPSFDHQKPIFLKDMLAVIGDG